MTDQERLEKLINGSTFDSNDINWLLEQAKLKQLLSERVDELESVEQDFWEMDRLQKDAHNDFLEMQHINQRYKQALEEIAKTKGKNYFNGVHITMLANKARQALADTND